MKVAEHCPQLEHLSLDGCYQVNDPAIAKVAAGCPKLKYLSLGLCSTVKVCYCFCSLSY